MQRLSSAVGRLNPFASSNNQSNGGMLGKIIQDQGLLLAILIFGFILWGLSPVFLTKANIVNVLFQATILGVWAIGMTFVILTAGIDLSVGAVAGLVSVLSMGAIVDYGLPPAIGILVGLGAGAAIGAVNGLAVTKIGISPLIATLATLSAATGLAFAYSGGANIGPVPDILTTIARAEILSIPLLIPAVLVLAVLAHLVLTRTSFGRSVYAVGGNPEAARLAGIQTDRVKLIAYIICGVTASVAGLMLVSRLGSGSPRAGAAEELTVIAAVVIGGTSLFGGQGDIKGSMLGVLLITMVGNAVNLLGVGSAYDQIVQGAVIFIAAAIDVYRRRYTERVMSRSVRAEEESSGDSKEEQSPSSADDRASGHEGSTTADDQ